MYLDFFVRHIYPKFDKSHDSIGEMRSRRVGLCENATCDVNNNGVLVPFSLLNTCGVRCAWHGNTYLYSWNLPIYNGVSLSLLYNSVLTKFHETGGVSYFCKGNEITNHIFYIGRDSNKINCKVGKNTTNNSINSNNNTISNHIFNNRYMYKLV